MFSNSSFDKATLLNFSANKQNQKSHSFSNCYLFCLNDIYFGRESQ